MENMNAYFAALPGWLISALLIAVGWLAAAVARFIVVRLLTLLRFNQLCERTGAYDVLRKGEVRSSPAALVGRGLYWIILIGVLLEAVRLLNIGVATELRNRLVAAIPAMVSALLVFAIGIIVIVFLSGFVRTITRNAGSPYANLWSRITRWVGAVLVLAMALEQAEIRGSILAFVLQVVIAAFAFGMALACGLGCKDMARNAMEKLIADLKDRHRDSSKPDMEG